MVSLPVTHTPTCLPPLSSVSALSSLLLNVQNKETRDPRNRERELLRPERSDWCAVLLCYTKRITVTLQTERDTLSYTYTEEGEQRRPPVPTSCGSARNEKYN